MTNLRAVSAIMIFIAMTIGCTPTIEDMYEHFQSNITYSVGFTHTQLVNGKFRFIGKRIPTETRNLANGNTLYVYGDYWVQYHINRTPCDVYLEVELKTDKVVAARSEGDGCYMPY